MTPSIDFLLQTTVRSEWREAREAYTHTTTKFKKKTKNQGPILRAVSLTNHCQNLLAGSQGSLERKKIHCVWLSRLRRKKNLLLQKIFAFAQNNHVDFSWDPFAQRRQAWGVPFDCLCLKCIVAESHSLLLSPHVSARHEPRRLRFGWGVSCKAHRLNV